jgi:hypothetical protein
MPACQDYITESKRDETSHRYEGCYKFKAIADAGHGQTKECEVAMFQQQKLTGHMVSHRLSI